MKTIHLNLAAHPYRNLAPVYGTALVMGIVCGILLIYNVQTAYRFFVSTKETRAEISRVESEIGKEQRETQRIRSQIEKIDVNRLNAESQFINAQIEDRAFSWSRLLDDMERVTPKNVRIISINPTIDKDGKVDLTIAATAKNHEGMINFLRTLLADSRFEGPFPSGETVNDDRTVAFTLTTAYLPGSSELLR